MNIVNKTLTGNRTFACQEINLSKSYNLADNSYNKDYEQLGFK